MIGLQYTTTFTPDEDGDWDVSLSLAGKGNLFVDGKLVIDLSTDPQPGDSFFGLGTSDVRARIPGLKAGKGHAIEIRLGNADFIARGPPFFTRGGIRLGAVCNVGDDEGINAATKIAKEADGAHSFVQFEFFGTRDDIGF